MIPLLLMLVSHAGAWAFALVLAGRFTPRSGAGTLAGAGVLHGLIVSLAVLGTLGAGVFGAWGLAAAGVACWGGAVAFGGRNFWKAHARAAAAGLRAARRESPALTACALALLALAAIRGAVAAWACPPFIVDEAAYHLPKLVSWVQTGSFQRPILADARTWFPGGMQFLQAWWVGFLHHDVLVEGASVECAFAGAAAAGALARSCGLRRAASLFAAALFATVPVVLAQASSAMNDLAAGAALLAALAFALRRPWSLALAAAALGAGIKPTTLFALPAVAVAAAARLRLSPPATRLPRLAVPAVLAAALAVGGLWYVLNAAATGNPFHPVSLSPGTSQALGPVGSTVSRGPSADRFLRNTSELFGSRAFRIDGQLTAVTDARLGWGWTATLFGLPALAWLAISRPRARTPLAACALGAALVILMVEYDPWNARFIVWLSAAPCIAVAALASDAPRAAIPALLATAGALANLAQNALPPVFESPEAFRAVRAAGWRERDMLGCVILREAGGLKDPVALEAWRKRMAGTDAVLVVAGGSPSAALARGDFSRRLEFAVVNDPAEIAELARDLGCPAIYSQDGNGAPLPVVQEAVRRGFLRQMAPGWFEAP